MTENAVELTDVTKIYRGPPETHALRGLCLTIGLRMHTAVMGPSGSGKSTLLNLVGALDYPSSGTVRVAGDDLTEAGSAERTTFRRNKLGFVFQSFHLLADRSTVENVELALLCRDGRRKVSQRSLAHEALSAVGLQDLWDSMPRNLSGGEQQRVAIARALVTNPSILLMDEPTGNLDSRSAMRVIDVVESAVSRGLTVVTVTHDREVAARADEIISLRDGRPD